MAESFLRDVGVSIASAGSVGFIVNVFKLPLLLGYILAGVILGPHLGVGLITSSETISTISEIGLILLMYILGLEIDLKKLLKAGKAVFVNGITQFLGCVGLGFILFSALGFQIKGTDFSLVYLAIAASLSSTLVVVKILSDRMELDSFTSRLTLGILVLQDVWAIAFLATQPNLNDFKATVLLLSLVKATLLIIIAALLARFVLPWIFNRVAKQVELTLVMAMGWCFFMAGVANKLGLSLEMGALVAGVSIASFPYHAQIAVKVASLRDFFVTLFFVGLGLQIPMPDLQIINLALILVIFSIISRIITVFPVLYKLKYGNYGSLIPALNLGQISEFSLIILSLGIGHGHIDRKLLSAFIIALVISSTLSALVIPRAHQIYKKLNPWLIKIGFQDLLYREETPSPVESHGLYKFLFLGFFREASSLIREIETRHTKENLNEIMVVDFNPDTISSLQKKGIQVHYGDIGDPETLKHLGIESSKLILSTIPDSILKGTSNLKLLRAIKKIKPDAKMIVTAETIEAAKELYLEGATYVFMPRMVAAHYLADILERIESGNGEAVKQNSERFIGQLSEIIK